MAEGHPPTPEHSSDLHGGSHGALTVCSEIWNSVPEPDIDYHILFYGFIEAPTPAVGPLFSTIEPLSDGQEPSPYIFQHKSLTAIMERWVSKGGINISTTHRYLISGSQQSKDRSIERGSQKSPGLEESLEVQGLRPESQSGIHGDCRHGLARHLCEFTGRFLTLFWTPWGTGYASELAMEHCFFFKH